MSEQHPHCKPTPDDLFGLCGTTVAEKYRVESVVGAGGFGVVYRGVHTGFAEPIAIKCLKLPGELNETDQQKLLTRLQEEGRVLHRLSKQTSGIVQALDVGAVTTAAGTWLPYLVLEWLDGQTLAKLIAERRAKGEGRMPLPEAIDLLEPAAQALAVAHRQKVAHRDVKPENIFVTWRDGRRTVKVLDFGIAKVLTQHASFAATATQKQASAFTPSYGAPEQFNKKRGATGPWTDVFALALIFVELVCGGRALQGDDATQLYIASADPASRPTLRYHGVNASDAVEEVLLQALAVDPCDRYQDTGAFWSALRAAAGPMQVEVAPAPEICATGEFVRTHAIDFDAPLSEPEEAATEPSAQPHHDATADATAPLPLRAPPATRREGSGSSPPEPEPEPQPERTRPSAGTPRTRGGHERAVASMGGRGPNPAPSSASGTSLPWMQFMIGLSLAGAGALYWQLRSIGPAPLMVSSSAPLAPSVAPAPAAIACVAPPASAAPSATIVPAASASATSEGGGGAGGAAPPKIEPPAGMVLVAEASSLQPFFLDIAEVTTRAYVECVMAGRCKKATRVVLTEESARALGVPDGVDAMAPETLAAAWEKRCNQARNAGDHPINCVGFGSAEDYCLWKKKRLPTSAEWTLAAAGASGRRYAWGDEPPECSFACYGLNGSCLSSANEVASCVAGTRKRDATGLGIIDLAGNLSEWVSDEGRKAPGGGPTWRVLRGGSFLDEAVGLANTAERAAPPVTAHVSIGFRCAMDVPRKESP